MINPIDNDSFFFNFNDLKLTFLENEIECTKEIFLPQHFTLINEVDLLLTISEDNYVSPLLRMTGDLMTITLSVGSVVKCLLGISSIIGNVTTQSLKILSHIKHRTSHLSEDERQINCFTLYLKQVLETLPIKQKENYKRTPEKLINYIILLTAFLSRKCQGNQLMINKKINKEDIENSNENIRFFYDICSLSSLIRDLNLDADDDKAWNDLINLMINIKYSKKIESEEFMQVTLYLLIIKNVEIASLTYNDFRFKKAWENALQS